MRALLLTSLVFALASGPARADDRGELWAPVLDGAFVDGPDDALVTVVLFTAFLLPFANQVADHPRELRATYGGDLRVAWRQFPVDADSKLGAMAACAAARQGALSDYTDRLWPELTATRKLDAALLDRVAEEAGLGLARFRADRKGAACKKAVDADIAHAASLEVRGVPHFFVNGRRLGGAVPLSELVALVDAELVTARAAVAAGTPPAGYYKKHVLAVGIRLTAADRAKRKAARDQLALDLALDRGNKSFAEDVARCLAVRCGKYPGLTCPTAVATIDVEAVGTEQDGVVLASARGPGALCAGYELAGPAGYRRELTAPAFAVTLRVTPAAAGSPPLVEVLAASRSPKVPKKLQALEKRRQRAQRLCLRTTPVVPDPNARPDEPLPVGRIGFVDGKAVIGGYPLGAKECIADAGLVTAGDGVLHWKLLGYGKEKPPPFFPQDE